MTALLDRRLVVVAGKGGVGRTTVTAALGLAAARRGKRPILCEVGGQDRLPGLFGVDSRHGVETTIAAGVAAISIDPERAKREYLERQLHSGALAGLLGHSRVFQLLTAAAPGLAELMTIGKVWDLAQFERHTSGARYDLAIVDGPATGHGLALLEAPRTYANLARVGPIHRQALRIDESLRDPSFTALVGVTLPEEMPVNETLELEARLGDRGVGLEVVIVNGVYPERFSSEEAERIAALDGRVPAAVRPALGAALSEHGRARVQRAHLRRLRRRAAAGVTTLPFLFQPELGPPEVERLSRELERVL